ncbi:MAG: acyl-CoA dehydrogenase family protein [Bacteroidales bacterium]|nr:acyl-CoA dehydrogenase family protein [Bacteroidales bacterium]
MDPYKEIRGMDFFSTDKMLMDFLKEYDAAFLERNRQSLSDFGLWVGTEVDEQAEYSDRYAEPKLEAFEKYGNKTNRIVFNPWYKKAHAEAYARGIIGKAYGENPEPHLISFVMGYLLSHTDISIHCPVTMTGAVAYVLDTLAPEAVKEKYLHQLIRMDGKSLSGGTWATELHGGSDVGATTTVARKSGNAFELTGLKWFTSNADSGLAVATARPDESIRGSKGLGLYLVPSHLDDGKQNYYHIRRLKEKLGTRALATGEIDLEGTFAEEIVPPPYGLKAMMEALEYSRIHNTVSASASHRRAFLEAMAWTRQREAFGHNILQYPMVKDEILKILFYLEASFALSFESASYFDKSLSDENHRPWLRLATALAKYQTAEWAVQATKDSMEIIGGNAYTNEFPMSRIMRDVYSLILWEGPANIQAIEVARMCTGKNQIAYDAFRKKIAGFIHPVTSTWKAEAVYVNEQMKIIESFVSAMQADPAAIQIYARKAMAAMSRTLAAALLLNKAHKAVLQNNNFRSFLVAKGYIDLLKQVTTPGSELLNHRHYLAILNHEPVYQL